MSTDRSAAIALVAGTVAGLLTMALHPTGHDIVSNAATGDVNTLNMAVHSLALAGQPLLLAGLLALTHRLRDARALAVLAYVSFAFAVAAVMVAAVASGFLAPAAVAGFDGADATERTAMLNALHYTGQLNQAFARVHVIFSGVAIVLWSVAFIRTRELSRGLGVYGAIAGVAQAVGVLSGTLRLDIHGFGLVVLTQGVWLVLVARHLWRTRTM